jgi:hypothetical protein
MTSRRSTHYVVVIARQTDYVFANTAWMEDPNLPDDRTLRPDVDIEESQHHFKTEAEAYAFIRDWWRKS